jgi:DNA-binding HxlR family transcriptional regulator
MGQTGFAAMHCSLARSLDRMGRWWAPLILRDLSYGRQRFDDLTEDLGISRNLLTTRLNELVEAGVVTRTAYQQRPARYEYDLSDAGRDLVPGPATQGRQPGSASVAPQASRAMRARRSRSSAEMAPYWRTRSRSPGRCISRDSVFPSGRARPTKIVPGATPS